MARTLFLLSFALVALLLQTLASASGLCPCTCVSEYKAEEQCRHLPYYCAIQTCYLSRYHKGKICCDKPKPVPPSPSPTPTPTPTPKPKGCPCFCTSRRKAKFQCRSYYYIGKCWLSPCFSKYYKYGQYECCDKIPPSPSSSPTPTPSPSPKKKFKCPCKCRFGKKGLFLAFKECKFHAYYGCEVSDCFGKYYKGSWCCDH